MIPTFLRPEAVPYASVDLIARKTDTQPPLVTICAWCPDFDRTAAANKGASHVLCLPCAARLEAEMA